MRPGATARVATMDAVVELPCGNTCPRSIGRLAPLCTQGTSRPKSLPQSTRWWTRSLAGRIAPPRNRSIHGAGWKLPVGFRAGWFQGAGRTEELDLGVGADASMRSVGRKSFVWCRDRPGDADSRLWPGGSHRGIRCGIRCGVVSRPRHGCAGAPQWADGLAHQEQECIRHDCLEIEAAVCRPRAHGPHPVGD